MLRIQTIDRGLTAAEPGEETDERGAEDACLVRRRFRSDLFSRRCAGGEVCDPGHPVGTTEILRER